MYPLLLGVLPGFVLVDLWEYPLHQVFSLPPNASFSQSSLSVVSPSIQPTTNSFSFHLHSNAVHPEDLLYFPFPRRSMLLSSCSYFYLGFWDLYIIAWLSYILQLIFSYSTQDKKTMLAQLFSLQYCLHQPRYWNILNALNKWMDKKNLEYKHNKILWNFKSV